MTKAQLHKFIKDTRGLVRGADAQRQFKLLKLIKEARRQIAVADQSGSLDQSASVEDYLVDTQSADYLDEK